MQRTRLFVCLLFMNVGPLRHLAAQEPEIFAGHNGAVTMAAFVAGNDRIVTTSSDQTAKLWDVATLAELRSWNQHTGPLYCLSVSADGRTLVTGAQDNTLRVWDVPLNMPLRRLTEPGPAVRAIALSADGKSVISGSADKNVRIADRTTAAAAGAEKVMPAQRTGHEAEIQAVASRSDGVTFASADAVGRIFLWSPDLDKPLGSLRGHSGKVTNLIFTANNQQLLSAGDDGKLRVWQLMPILPKLVSTTETEGLSVTVVPGQAAVVHATAGGICRVVNLQTGEIIREFPKPDAPLSDLALSPNSAWIVMNLADSGSRIVNFNDGMISGIVAGHDGVITDSAVHPDSQRFATSGRDGTLRLWKLPPAKVPLAGHSAPIRGVLSAASGQWTATISDDMTTRLWNSTGGAVQQLGNHTQPLRAVAVRDDDALLATGDAEGTVWIWNSANGAVEGVVTAHAGAITSLAFSADRSSLVTAGADGTLRSWTLPLPKAKPAAGEEPPKPAWEVKSPDNTPLVQLARVSPEHGLLALSSTGSQLLRFKWDGSVASQTNSPGGVLRKLDVSPAGTSVLATADSGQVHLFAADGTLQKSLPPLQGLTSARFDREGKFLVLCDGQPRIRIAAVDTGRVHEEIRLTAPVMDADWTAADQRSVVATGTGNDGVLVQQALLRLWENLPGGAASVFFSPDQQTVLAGGADGAVRQWSLADGNQARTFEGHTGPVSEVAMSPNGQLVCAAGEDKTLQVWKTADGSKLHALTHEAPVRSLSISPDSARVAASCDDGIVRVWDLVSGQLLETFSEHNAGTAVTSVRYVNDNVSLVSTGVDKTLRTMKTSAVRTVPIHPSGTFGMASFGGGTQIISTGSDGRVVMTNCTTGNADRVFVTGDRRPLAVTVRADNQRVAAGCENGEILIWNAGNGEQTLQVLDAESSVVSLAWSPDNRLLAAVTEKKELRVFGPSVTGVQPPVELTPHQIVSTDEAITKLLFAPDSRSVWTSLVNGRIDEWACAEPEQRRQFNHGGPVYGVACSRDGSTIVSCSVDQTVRVWNNVTGQQKFQLNGHNGPVHAVAMNPDETFAVSSGADGTLRLWDIVGGRQLKQLITYNATMYSVAMHREGSLIAAAGADRTIHLLDMITGTEQRTLTGHKDYIHCVTFSPNGEQILSYGYAGELKLWNTADGRLLYETEVGRIGNYAQFSQDGRSVVLANGDGTARIHRLP